MVVITCGFQEVKLDCFRQKTLNKGKKLLDSYHVSGVQEAKFDNFSEIRGTVLRETPGAVSARKHENTYSPVVKLHEDRSVEDTDCNCKAGKGFCKHAAAICMYVNVENTCSKTDKPMVWNRPPQAQLDLYSKGCRVESMFPHPVGSIPETRPYTFKDLQDIPPVLYAETSSHSIIMNSEMKCLAEKDQRMREKDIRDNKLKSLLKKLYEMQIDSKHQRFHAHTSEIVDGILKIRKMTCPAELLPAYEKVIVSEDKWLDIAFESVTQSGTSVWYSERHMRITSSMRAHRIKTRQQDLKALARQFCNEKYKGRLTSAMEYGLRMERQAKTAFEGLTGLEVYDVGLIVSADQPFLACSPDGILRINDNYELLEIKCPYSCENRQIVDFQTSTCFVPYLQLDENNDVFLKESDKYYTQIQLSMYILGFELCHLHVYSTHDQVHIVVKKDTSFLETLIPKLESFYFEYFITLIPQ